jgi:F-type H+-transporting ATPase subunit a
MNLLNVVATTGPKVYIAPAPIGHFLGLTITNSMLYGWICLVAMIVLFTWVAHRMSIKPKGGFIQYVELVVEFITNTVETAFEDKSKARKYLPYFVTLFCFLLFNNLSGMLPFANDAFTAHNMPLLRPMTGDLNTTLAAAVVTMGLVYTASIRETGSVRKYFRHFFIGSPLNPLYLVLGLLEMLSDVTRVISLSLRLFLNIAIGEIIVAVFAYLGHILAPVSAVAFYLIDGFDGALQAFIFTILAIMYLAIVVNQATEAKHHGLTHGVDPETMSPNLARDGMDS